MTPGFGFAFGFGIGGLGVVAFNPLSLGLTAYYDPSNIASLWKDTAGTQPVTAHGDAVARMDDLSSNDFHLTQATLGNRPLYQVSGAEKFLLFDGTDDNLNGTFAGFTSLPFDRITALRQVAWTSSDVIWFHSGPSARLRMRPTTPSLEVHDGIADAVTSNALGVGTSGVVTERHIAGASQIAINNGAYTTGNAGSTAPGTTVLLGGNTTSGGISPNFRFYGAGIKAGTLTAAEIALLRTELGAKCGVTL